jgi:hypothetical protein
MKAIMAGFSAKLYRKSVSAVAMLEGSLLRIMIGCVVFVTFAGVLRTMFAVSPINSGLSFIQQRERIKRQTIEYQRLQHGKLAA